MNEWAREIIWSLLHLAHKRQRDHLEPASFGPQAPERSFGACFIWPDCVQRQRSSSARRVGGRSVTIKRHKHVSFILAHSPFLIELTWPQYEYSVAGYKQDYFLPCHLNATCDGKFQTGIKTKNSLLNGGLLHAQSLWTLKMISSHGGSESKWIIRNELHFNGNATWLVTCSFTHIVRNVAHPQTGMQSNSLHLSKYFTHNSILLCRMSVLGQWWHKETCYSSYGL